MRLPIAWNLVMIFGRGAALFRAPMSWSRLRRSLASVSGPVYSDAPDMPTVTPSRSADIVYTMSRIIQQGSVRHWHDTYGR